MRILFFIFFFLGGWNFAHASDDYIILLEGDTVMGTVTPDTSSVFHNGIFFENEEGAENYRPGDLIGFGYEGVSYKSFDAGEHISFFKVGQAFLERVVSGGVKLYVYEYQILYTQKKSAKEREQIPIMKSVYFVEGDDGVCRRLDHRSYKPILKRILNGNKSVDTQLSSDYFSYKQIPDLVREFNGE